MPFGNNAIEGLQAWPSVLGAYPSHRRGPMVMQRSPGLTGKRSFIGPAQEHLKLVVKYIHILGFISNKSFQLSTGTVNP
ncbi:protein of unknown function [Pseudomonas mediterranea]